MTISEEDWETVKHRVESMPSHLKLAIGGNRSLSRDDILQHLENRDEVGRRIVAMQMNYLKFFKKEMTVLLNE